jgi:uncharacterized protein (DUF697 family)/GTPase SAR1 family protein
MQAGDDAFKMAWEALKKILPLDLLETKMEEAMRDLGKVNILIAGATGVGKTTLINAIFGEKVGKTGVGAPVTQAVTWYEPPHLPVRLCDTRGLEMKDYAETLSAIEREIDRAGRRPEDTIHIAWLCISEQSARVQPGEQELAQLCHRRKIPVVVVVTKSYGDDEFVEAVRTLIPEAEAVVPVLAERRVRPAVEAHGLVELVAETERLLPKVAENAFLAAQQIDMSKKRSLALRIAGSSAVAAGAAALIPVPGAGPSAVLAINVGMVVSIAAAMGVTMDRAAMVALSASLVGGLAASTGGRMLLGEALKLIPGFGSAAGAAVEVSAAAATTYGLGLGFAEFMLWFHGRNARMPEGSELRDGFQKFWAQRKEKQITPPAN